MKRAILLLKQRLLSVKYALNGIKILFLEEPNAIIHLLVTVCVLIAGFVFQISNGEWIAVILCVSFVIAMEAVNSAIENIADFISPEKHETIKKVKDLAAGAVLIGAIASAIVGMIIFLPKIIELLMTFYK